MLAAMPWLVQVARSRPAPEACRLTCYGTAERRVQLQNGNGVILQLSGPKVGAEVPAPVGGVTITMQ